MTMASGPITSWQIDGKIMEIVTDFNFGLKKHQFLSTQLCLWFHSNIYTIPLTRRAFAGKVMSLLFNILSRLIIAFLPRSKHLFSWLQSSSAVILKPKTIKSVTVSLYICHEVMGPDALNFINIEF